MTIDETIAHEKRISKDNKVHNFENIVNYHEQIAEWLQELKSYKEKPEGWMWDEAEMKGYNKAVDDFVKIAKEHDFKYGKKDITNCVIGFIEFFAEQLKAGGENEE